MATIKPIEHKSVHQIQSGQVIGDGLTSVVKELVENSLDAHATSLEVRFKNYGLDAIEVVDNGSGITPDNYESVALKHWTSKLTTYDDLDSVTTFGFRGEALSSLCALSDLQVTTATASEAPKGTRLEFEVSGKLKSRSVAAAQRGTAVLVENIFKTLPVRRKELERNVKREYTKVLGVLQAYAGVCVGVKFSVFNQPAKGRRAPVFATKGNPTTRENIANIFGAKTLSALVALDLKFEMKSTRRGVKEAESKDVKIIGHISRPIVGEGRQAPDRQMFFVNGRPCVLPQISRAFNEVYKGFNVTQSPFIFADLQIDTNAYDVNVSPDKRSILLHDQTELLESLKASLLTMFTNHEQTVPHSQLGGGGQGKQGKLPGYKQLTINSRGTPVASSSVSPTKQLQQVDEVTDSNTTPRDAAGPHQAVLDDDEPETIINDTPDQPTTNRDKAPPVYTLGTSTKLRETRLNLPPRPQAARDRDTTPEPAKPFPASTITADEVILLDGDDDEILLPPPLTTASASLTFPPDSSMSTAMTSPLSKLSYRSPRRPKEGKATITIGDREPVTMGSSPPPESPSKRRKVTAASGKGVRPPMFKVGALSRFAAPGTQVEVEEEVGEEEEGGEGWLQDKMVLDEEGGEDEADEGLEEVFRDASQVEDMVDGQGVGRDINMEEEVLVNRERENPLFIPNPELDTLSSDDEDVAEEVVLEEEVEQEPFNIQEEEPFGEQEEDGDFADPSSSLIQSSLRAQRLLEEAEEAAAQPTSKGLERAFRILEGSRTHSSKNLVRSVSTSTAKIRQQAKMLVKSSGSSHSQHSAPTLTEDDVSAEELLNLTISKRDFFEMQIKGQFNRGFILATRTDDLFIIDQHASDEKYNFETLQRDTVVQNQRLVVPKTLELMAMDEIIVQEHIDVFRKNGFVIEVDPDAPTGARCSLVSLPLSGSTVFGIKDLEELIHLVHESQGADTAAVRCSKMRSMFAMRACKKSTKVGRALTVKGMEKIVRHMGELDKPWNCPHGRPTMRHLVELGRVPVWEEGMGGLQWGGETWQNVMMMMEEEGYEEQGE